MKYSLPGSETVTLTGQTIDKLIRAGDGDATLLYLYILKTRGECSSTEAAAALGRSSGGIAKSMEVLSHLGLVRLDGNDDTEKTLSAGEHMEAGNFNNNPQNVQAPGNGTNAFDDEPTVEDMKRALESGSVFSALIGETQRSLGKILSNDELLRLFGMYDNLKMEPEVILQLITHCITESRARSKGRMPSIRYIEKAAYTWEREGIRTLNAAEQYIKELDARRSARGTIKSVLQIRDRELSETEGRYVDGWIALGFGADAIAVAYDKTIIKTGKLQWKYIDAILNSWHSSGLHTIRDIMDSDRTIGKNIADTAPKSSKQKFGAADKKEFERMQRLLNKLKEE
ncbi:MAG: DnaD domain protein [Oscillospiraceae bacterium]|nr:DnaD domain protein [Oscillospiraceae bacterium]